MNSLKAFARKVAPNYYGRLQDARSKRLLKTATEKVLNKYGTVVQGGPFAGMMFTAEASAGSLIPKIIGSYECELHDIVKAISSESYQTIVNIGCAEGYYAVGLARLFPTAHVHAFDLDARARKLCKETAASNNVAVSIHEGCTNFTLSELIDNPGRSLVVSDCEGGELELLDPRATRGFDNADILVELHDFINPSISKEIFQRFGETHNITVIDSEARRSEEFPKIMFLEGLERKVAISEFRPENMQWAYLTPKKPE